MKKVVATGVFAILHPGHILFLEEAKKLGDELIVIVTRDKTLKKRGKPLYVPEEQRVRVINSLRVVDKAILGDDDDIFKPISEITPDIIAIGKDQEFDVKELEKKLRNRNLNVEVVKINKYLNDELCSTRKIVKRIKNSN